MEKKILLDLACSLYRILLGVVLAFAVGVPVGIFIGYFSRFYDYVESALDFFRSIPPILVFPLSLLIFGIGEESRIAVIFFGCVLTMILNASMGVVNSQKIRVKVAKIMGATWLQILFRVVIYDALPQIFIGIRVALSMGVIVGIVTEMLVGTRHGLGSRVVYAQTAYATPEMYFTIIVVGLLGFLINNLLIVLERKTIHWKQYS
ncbi:MAG: ABC transporter permease subunit [Deltaproteobacteria bacterium]|nr:ABC transporter permease subunit [Deltaproteobacteria bacterium]